MESNTQIWQTWANALQRWGLTHFAATLLEAFGPLNLFGAQMIYLTHPLMSTFVPAPQLDALADLLEDSHNTQAFVGVLRQTESRRRA